MCILLCVITMHYMCVSMYVHIVLIVGIVDHEYNSSVIQTHRSFLEHIGRLARMSVLDTEVDGSNPGNSTLFP